MIKKCFCSLSFRDEPLEAIIPKLAKIGYDGIEVFGNHIDGCSDDELLAIRELADECGIQLPILSPYFWLTNSTELLNESLERAQRFTHYASILGATRIRTFTDCGPTGIGSDVATEEHWDTAVKALKQITAMDRDLLFVVEGHVKTLADTPESALKLMSLVDAPNFRMLYQPEGDNIIEGYYQLKDHIHHMHLHNSAPDSGGWLEEEGTDLGKLLKIIKSDGYDGTMSVEYCWRDVPWSRAESAFAWLSEQLS